MSQLTLFDEDFPESFDALNQKNYYVATHDLESGDIDKHPVKSFASDLLDDNDCDGGFYSEDQPLFEGEFEKPHIHMLKLGDTMRSICKTYNVSPDLVEKTNKFSEVTEELLSKRKFVLIPSASTFNLDSNEDIDYEERLELVKNFCFLFNEISFDQADFLLAKATYNLALAVENYQYEIC